MPNHVTPASLDRDRIKSLVASGRIKEIQQAIDNGHFKRKQRKVAEVDTESNRLHIVATTDTVDRDSERILPRSLEKDFAYYKENPVVLFGHDHRIPAVGKMTDHAFSDEQMKMEIEFAVEDNPLARMLWGLYSKEYMRMSSIGFIPLEWTDDEQMKMEGQKGLTYLRAEIIELSLVNVGSNRHALADLPTSIKGDPVLADIYAKMMEEPESLADAQNGTRQPILVNGEYVHIPEHNDNLPLHIHLNVGGGSEHEIATTEQETSETMAKQKAQKCPNSDKKQPRLVRLLNKLVDDRDDRAACIASISDEALITTDMVEQALKGEFQLDSYEIEAFAKVLKVERDLLMKAKASDTSSSDASTNRKASAEAAAADDSESGLENDELEASEFEDDEIKAADDYKEKFYGMMSESFEGSYEARQAAIYRDLDDFLEFKLGGNEYGYVDFSVLATYDDHVIVRDWEDGGTYKATYSIDTDGEVEFTELVQIRIITTYEEIEDEDGMPVTVETAYAEAAD